MSNAVLRIDEESVSLRMTEAQRSCILHVVRNSACALEGLALLLEQSDSSPTPDDLHGCIRGVIRALSNMDESFQNGSFCPLHSEDCAYISKWVGCCGNPIGKK